MGWLEMEGKVGTSAMSVDEEVGWESAGLMASRTDSSSPLSRSPRAEQIASLLGRSPSCREARGRLASHPTSIVFYLDELMKHRPKQCIMKQNTQWICLIRAQGGECVVNKYVPLLSFRVNTRCTERLHQ